VSVQPYPAPTATSPRAGRWFGVTQGITALGAGLVLISAPLGWFNQIALDGTSAGTNAFGLPTAYLVSASGGPTGAGLGVGVLLAAIALVTLLTVVVPGLNVVRWVSGGVAALIPTLYVNQLFHDSAVGGSYSMVGGGPKLCVAAALLILVGNCRGGGGPRPRR
jgi:hypothetical protein